jgi:IS4 transposase
MFRLTQFQEILKYLPRPVFEKFVDKHQSDKSNKGFDSWAHLVAMVYGQLGGVSSLRTLITGFNRQHPHYHLGIKKPLCRSTISDANAHRAPEVFSDALKLLMTQVKRRVRSQVKDMLCLLDSTSITLKGDGFDVWTLEHRTRNTQGIKLHMLLEGQTASPLACSMTAANVNDRNEGVRIAIEQGSLYVFDKGYCDYAWWHKIHQVGATFVTRFKKNARLSLVEERLLTEEDRDGILKDEWVVFSNPSPGRGRRNPYRMPLRRVTVARPDTDTPLVLATNDLDSPARVIAERYKARWQIELFFKWIKQHLNIQRFLGRSQNAVKIQILIALMTYVLLLIHHAASNFKGSLWMLLAEVRPALFTRPQTSAATRRRKKEEQQEIARIQPGLFA